MPAESGYAAFLRDLPPDWPSAPIAEVARVVGGGTPSRDVGQFWNGSIPWVTPGEISAETAVSLNDTREHISPAGLVGSGATLLPAGSLMITTRATLGARAINLVPMTTNQGFKSLVFPDSEDSQFFYYLTEKLKPELKRRASGTTFLEVSGGELARIRVPVPPKGERTQIAMVLDTLDTTIRQTEAIIDKLKQIKQGLLHDLLTRGIADNGELRPPQSEAPHLYKESALGWIPIRWDVCGVLDIAPADRQCILTGPFGAQLGQADFISEGVPVLRIGNVQAGYIDWTDTQFVSYAKAARLDRFSVLSGDLLFARQGATTGRNALADDRSNGALINYHLIRVAVDRRRCEPTFLHAAFNSHHSRGQVDQEKGRGTREGINSKQIAALRFVLPPIGEQITIVARVEALGGIMAQEVLLAAKQRTLKSGLMDDLLTGRVRVGALQGAQN